MTTQIIAAEQGIARGAEIIKQGGLVVFPTETVYGLGADAFNAEAVAQIFAVKGRPQDNPLIVHIARIEDVERIAKDIPDDFYKVAEAYMPGPVTVVLKKRDCIPDIVTAGGDTVAVRMPQDKWARALIAASSPLAAPSANRSKHISPTTARHVFDDIGGRVPLILDGGSSGVGIESTVLDLTTDTPTVLRPGAVTAEMLSRLLGDVGENGRVIKTAKSPGMKYTHYSPVCETVVAESAESAKAAYDNAKSAGKNAVIVATDAFLDMTGNRCGISLGADARECMRSIYSALRTAEKEYDYIIIEELKGSGIEASVMNRINKAAGGKRV